MHDTSEFTFTKFWFVSCYSLYTTLSKEDITVLEKEGLGLE